MRRASPSAGASSSPTRRSRTSPPTTRRPPRSSPTSSRIGTTSTSISAARRSPRRATASSASAASACSKSCRTARASLASCCTSMPSAIPPIRSGATTISSSPRTAPTRASATRTPEAFGVDVDVRAQQVRLARHVEGVRRLHLRLRGDRARLDLGARLSLRARLLDLHRRMFGGDLARLRLRPDVAGREHRRVREAVRQISRRPSRCSPTPRTCVGSAAWLNFRRIKCERWSSGNVILLGDAAHTAHFSIGSGTKLALEDAIKLAEVLNRPRPRASKPRSTNMQPERNLEVLKLQNSARNSTEWFETLERYLHFEPLQFAYSLLTRSQRISHENLRLRDREWLEGVERWFWKRATDGRSNKTAPPMFAPFKLREMQVENRITVSPMAMYSAVDGTPNDFHFVHYGERAIGGAGPGLHRDDLRLARRPDQPRLHRHVERRARRRVEAHRRFRPRQFEGEDLPPARPFRRQGLDHARLGRERRPARRRQLAGDGGERRALVAGQPGAARR